MAFRIKPKSATDDQGYKQPKIVGEIRKSQIITTFGPGALIDFPRMSGIIRGTDEWESTLGKFNFEKMKIHEQNLEHLLQKSFFIQPKMLDEKNYVNGISIERFPEYCYCPECGLLDKYYKIERKPNSTTKFNSESYCGVCYQTKNRNVKLIPSRFVVSCKCGHITDFPYEWWVHKKTGRCANPRLQIEMSKTRNGLEGIVVRCKCGSEETLEGIMDKGALHQLRCFGDMPWLGKKDDYRGWYSQYTTEEPCAQELRVLQRGANNVYYPQIISALTIPPYSSRIQRMLASDITKLSDYNDKKEKMRQDLLREYYETNKDLLRCDWEQFLHELKYALGIMNAGYDNLRELIRGEYDALCDDDCNDPDFLTIETEISDELKGYIDQVKIVGRLREVQVLEGFRRISQEDSLKVPLSRHIKDWLPANELYGEGIFIRFNEQHVQNWERATIHRYMTLTKRAENNIFVQGKISKTNTRYILLHSFAHLFIRELTLQCGYTAASLKEKIYSSQEDEETMCGVLIYTSSSDSDGSLGGLARQGVANKIRNTVFTMLENASWCSNDPICMESKGQGYASMNYAACHACALLPETSCECNNLLLDRGALIGTSEEPKMGYFYKLL